MTVRALMKLTSEKSHAGWEAKELTFTAEYDTTIPEESRFWEATPTGSITMTVTSKAALEQFKLGEKYYVDFSPAPRQLMVEMPKKNGPVL